MVSPPRHLELHSLNTVRLAPGREKSVRNRHPWIFHGAITGLEGDPGHGESVHVTSADGRALGVGAWSPQSQISVRMWSFDPEEEIDAAFFRRRIDAAIARRGDAARAPGQAVRLVHAESDGLPGLHVDRYGEFLVVQILAAGCERWRGEIAAALEAAMSPRGIFERSDADVRGKEGLEPRTGCMAGEDPPALVEIQEGACRFLVDVREGHKTGFYLDQRENRMRVGEIARGREVLNAFAYTGGFAVHALVGGAVQVTNVETSLPSLELAEKIAELNGVADRMELIEADVFSMLRRYRDEGRSFDTIILDPPKFAESKAQVERAARGYKDINLLAFKLLRPGGTLFTFSCSGLMPADLFQKIVADAALDARRDAWIVRRLTQASDHPVALAFPEAGYLKGLVVRVG